MLRNILSIVCLLSLVECIFGHGMVMDPPNRGSLWRFDGTSPKNYNDNGNFCGGYSVQWTLNGGKCGICGDDFADPQPRANENTGFYGRGKIAKTYKSGQIMEVSVLVTANHRGWFQFSICELTDVSKPETDDCFQVVELADGQDKYVLPSSDTGYFSTNLRLPEGLTCEHCVLRWHWNTGNSWGICEDRKGELGCGAQENFRSCSDIAIV